MYIAAIKMYEKWGVTMFERLKRAPAIDLVAEKVRLMELREKELLVEMVLELKRISEKCDEIGRKIVIWSN